MIQLIRMLGWVFIAGLFILTAAMYLQYIDRYGFDLLALKGLIAGFVAGATVIIYWSIRLR